MTGVGTRSHANPLLGEGVSRAHWTCATTERRSHARRGSLDKPLHRRPLGLPWGRPEGLRYTQLQTALSRAHDVLAQYSCAATIRTAA